MNHTIKSPITLIHYSDAIMSPIASQMTSMVIVYSIVCSCVNQRKYKSSASVAFVRRIHLWPVNYPHRRSVTRKMFPFYASSFRKWVDQIKILRMTWPNFLSEWIIKIILTAKRLSTRFRSNPFVKWFLYFAIWCAPVRFSAVINNRVRHDLNKNVTGTQFIHLDYLSYRYNDVITGTIASQIISLTIVFSTVYSDADQRKH